MSIQQRNPFLVIAALLAGGMAAATLFIAVNPWAPAGNSTGPAGDPLQEVRSSKRGLRVLFIGNSFTHFHNMPDMLRQLAEAAHEELPLLAMQVTPGGYTLQQHCEDGRVAELIEQNRWDYVVLQEQSQGPSFSRRQREEAMYPSVRQLDAAIRAAGARTVLFSTWGYKSGDTQNQPGDSFAAMQQRLRTGYLEIAEELSASLALVGDAWERALEQRSQTELWDSDGIHPSPKGSYLAACVFYALLYGQSPSGNAYTAGLEAIEARFLQDIAASVVSPPSPEGK